MIKYFKYLLFIFIVFISFNVSAYDYNVSSSIGSPSGGSSYTHGYYQGTELNGSTGPFAVGTRYNGTLTNIQFNLPVPSSVADDCWPTNMTYTITMNMATEDWRNRFGSVSVKSYSSSPTNFSNGNVSYISMKKIKFSFKIPSSDTTCHDFVYVNLPSNGQFNPFTGETNWNLSSVIVSDTLSNSSGGGSSSPTPTPVASNQDVINNQNQNTQDIINNNNTNTSDIIENNNSNTEQIIESQEEINNSLNSNCKNGPQQFSKEYNITFGKSLSDTGVELISSGYITTYFNILGSTEYTIDTGSTTSRYYCLYNGNKSLVSCSLTNGRNATFTTGNNVRYLRVSMSNNANLTITGPVCNNWEQEGLKDISDTIKDDSIDDKTGFFTDFSNNDHGLTGIISLPLSTIQSLANTSCISLSLPVPFTNDNFTLPCMTQVYQSAVPDIFSMWQVVSFGIISYYICIDIFKMVKGFKDPNEDKIEVLDL